MRLSEALFPRQHAARSVWQRIEASLRGFWQRMRAAFPGLLGPRGPNVRPPKP